MRKFALAAGLVALLGLAPSAHALSVDVTYNISTTTSVLNGLLPIGTFTGTATIRYSGNAAGTAVVPGKARLLSLVQTGPINVVSPLLGTASVTGFQTVTAGLQTQGGFTFGGNLLLPLSAAGTGFVHCIGGAGTACTGVVGLPKSVTVPAPLAILTVLNASAPITTGAGDVLPTFTMTAFLGSFASLPISGTSTFTEVSRTATPEPSSLAMLWVGLAGLAGARSWQRRRRRS